MHLHNALARQRQIQLCASNRRIQVHFHLLIDVREGSDDGNAIVPFARREVAGKRKILRYVTKSEDFVELDQGQGVEVCAGHLREQIAQAMLDGKLREHFAQGGCARTLCEKSCPRGFRTILGLRGHFA